MKVGLRRSIGPLIEGAIAPRVIACVGVCSALFDRWTSIGEIVFWLANNRHWANVAAWLRLHRAIRCDISGFCRQRLAMTARTGNKPATMRALVPLLTETSRILLLCRLCTRRSPVRSYSWRTRGNVDHCEIRARGPRQTRPLLFLTAFPTLILFTPLPPPLSLSLYLCRY